MTPAAIDFGTLCDELDAIIAGPPARDEAARARFERTLTDGYARALSLEAERRRLQKQIGTLTATVGSGDADARRELTALLRQVKRQEGDLGTLRDQLGRLRRRHSSAVRAGSI